MVNSIRKAAELKTSIEILAPIPPLDTPLPTEDEDSLEDHRANALFKVAEREKDIETKRQQILSSRPAEIVLGAEDKTSPVKPFLSLTAPASAPASDASASTTTTTATATPAAGTGISFNLSGTPATSGGAAGLFGTPLAAPASGDAAKKDDASKYVTPSATRTPFYSLLGPGNFVRMMTLYHF